MKLNKFMLNLILCVFSNFYLITNGLQQKQQKESLIGKDVSPFLVSVQEKSRHLCSGSILSKTLVIVAAHCVSQPNSTTSKQASNLQVVYSVNGSDLSKLSPVEMVNIHPNYSGPTSLQYDVALLVVILDGIADKAIPRQSKPYPIDCSCYAVGLQQFSKPKPHMKPLVSPARLVQRGTCARTLRTLSKEMTTIHTCTRNAYVNDAGALLWCEGEYVAVRTMSMCLTGNLTVWTEFGMLDDWINRTQRATHSRIPGSGKHPGKPRFDTVHDPPIYFSGFYLYIGGTALFSLIVICMTIYCLYDYYYVPYYVADDRVVVTPRPV